MRPPSRLAISWLRFAREAGDADDELADQLDGQVQDGFRLLAECHTRGKIVVLPCSGSHGPSLSVSPRGG